MNELVRFQGKSLGSPPETGQTMEERSRDG